MSFTIRDATVADHASFARLFPELRVADPLPTADQFAERMLPRVMILEERDDAIGYTHWRRYGPTAHVVHVVVDPRARGKSAGRALLEAVRARAASEGCTRWFLNVKQDNAPAIRLYERAGMAIEQEAWAVDVRWSELASLPGEAEGATPFAPVPSDGAELVAHLGGDIDRVALLLANPGTAVLRALRAEDVPVAFGAFDPAFPGVHALRVARVTLARPLFDAFRPHARHDHDHVHVTVEADRGLYDGLRGVGATLRHAVFRMGGRLNESAESG
jgi:GNAT superfamily N-acetyltransferase